MTKLEKVIAGLKSKDGTAIDKNIIKRLSVSIDYSDAGHFKVLGWEAKHRGHQFSVLVDIEHFEDIVAEMLIFGKREVETLDLADEPEVAVWGAELKQEESNELRDDNKEVGALFGK